MIVQTTSTKCLKINAPEIFTRPDFIDWLNGRRQFPGETTQVATWHTGGNPNEYSDVFIYYYEDAGGDFDASDDSGYGLPIEVREQLTRVCRIAAFSEGVLWLTNLK